MDADRFYQASITESYHISQDIASSDKSPVYDLQ